MEARGEGFEAITSFFEIWLGTELKGGKCVSVWFWQN